VRTETRLFYTRASDIAISDCMIVHRLAEQTLHTAEALHLFDRQSHARYCEILVANTCEYVLSRSHRDLMKDAKLVIQLPAKDEC
jgi:hypothetical protein